MRQGRAGLLDDTSLVLRILENLDRGPSPFLDWELSEPLMFLRWLVGESVAVQLDAMSGTAMTELSDQLSVIWNRMAERH